MSEENLDNEELEPFTELERRYLITFLLTEELNEESLFDELDSIAQKLEDEVSGAEEMYLAYEKKITDKYSEKFSFPELDAVEAGSEMAASLKDRIRLLYYVASLDEDEEWVTELKESAVTLKGADDDQMESLDEEVTLMEEDIVSFYFSEEEGEHDHDDDDDDDEEEGEE